MLTNVCRLTLPAAAVALLLPLPSFAQTFSSPALPAETSWIGNSYGGGKKWVQQDIAGLTVTSDGTVFTNVPWDEGGGNAGEYRDGELIRYGLHTHGWGNEGGEAVACNSRYVYLAVGMSNEHGHLQDPATWPPKGSKWIGVSRRQRSNIENGAPFPGGKGGQGSTLKESLLVVEEIPDDSKATLPCLSADEERLYVADPITSQITAFDAETMQPVTNWKIDRAGPLAGDGAKGVWLLERAAGAEPARLIHFNAAGEVQSSRTFGPGIVPVAFCVAPDGRVFIADDGPAQQIRIYGAHESTFGEVGGTASGTPGAFADRKLNHVTALGVDAHHNLYVAHDAQSGGGGTVLESYALEGGKLNWRLLGLTFVDLAEIDAAQETEVFTKEEHFHLDYSQPAGREWSYTGYTIGKFKYPEDPRLHLWSAGAWVRQIGGQRILFVNDMNGDNLQVYRFAPATDGEVAIPSGLFAKRHLTPKDHWPPQQPEKGEWIWRDANGDGAFEPEEYSIHEGQDAPASQGWWVDQAGGIWLATEKAGLRYFPSQGFDPIGNPRWDYATMQTFPAPPEFLEVKRLRYDVTTDTLYLGGTTAQEHNQHWKPMGPVLARYDGWLHGARKLRWQITLPYAHGASGHESCEPMAFDLAGDFLFVPYTGASKSSGVKTGRVEIIRAENGEAAGHVEPGEEVGEVGLQDIREDITAHRRADGEYIVLIEDDYKSKVVMYRLKSLR